MEKATPNGPEIAKLRKAKGFKQIDFAEKVGMSIRKYRDVETRSRPISPRELQEIADKLSDKLNVVPVERLAAPGDIEHAPEPPWAGEIQLRPVDGPRLIAMARMSDDFDYHVLVRIGNEHLDSILPILRVVRRSCDVTAFIKGPGNTKMMNLINRMRLLTKIPLVMPALGRSLFGSPE
jgi:transcriptional regulator with XRE-family HTH domain